MPVHPGSHHLSDFPSVEEPVRSDIHRLSGFFDSVQGRRDGVHDAPSEGPSDTPLSDVFDDLDGHRQSQNAQSQNAQFQSTPAEPSAPSWPFSYEASDGGASTSPGVSDAENEAPSTHSPPEPNRSF